MKTKTIERLFTALLILSGIFSLWINSEPKGESTYLILSISGIAFSLGGFSVARGISINKKTKKLFFRYLYFSLILIALVFFIYRALQIKNSEVDLEVALAAAAVIFFTSLVYGSKIRIERDEVDWKNEKDLRRSAILHFIRIQKSFNGKKEYDSSCEKYEKEFKFLEDYRYIKSVYLPRGRAISIIHNQGLEKLKKRVDYAEFMNYNLLPEEKQNELEEKLFKQKFD